jgi:NADH:ubiquinone oxidoreductase subunit 3 (subunit A)
MGKYISLLVVIVLLAAFVIMNLMMSKSELETAYSDLKNRAPEIIEKEIPVEVRLESPFNTPEIIQIADAIIKLQPKTTPFVAKFMALHITRECEAKKLDPDLVTAQLWVESEFNPNALSKAGAVGLGQVRYEIWKQTPQLTDNGVTAKHKLYWIDNNIQSSTSILRSFLDEAKGDLARALYRYYCGSKELEKGKAPWNHEYVAKILYYYFKIRDHRLYGIPIEVEEIAAAPVVEATPKHAAPASGVGRNEASMKK